MLFLHVCGLSNNKRCSSFYSLCPGHYSGQDGIGRMRHARLQYCWCCECRAPCLCDGHLLDDLLRDHLDIAVGSKNTWGKSCRETSPIIGHKLGHQIYLNIGYSPKQWKYSTFRCAGFHFQNSVHACLFGGVLEMILSHNGSFQP